MRSELLNGMTLAYIGDAYYELLVRNLLVESGITKVNDLHKKAITFTSGESQCKIMAYFLENDILTENEISIFKKGRNVHTNQHRKNISVIDYQTATGFEALIGYLYIQNDFERVNELFRIIYNSINKEWC